MYRSLWGDLKHLEKPLLIVAGEKDVKFKEISEQMCSEIRKHGEREADCRNRQEPCEMIVVPESGHAVHVENPLPLVRAIRKFLLKLHKP
jgi:isochorismate synthase/2-succinyl-5-enolpyruvyl-6-hydroxy-3-cyclohexene-1-carboxylate synthase/2-succinyl-6-hydroxy-2,4-cyclohexadiene-1-carboxylate synthase/O-succinylbenzoate synthase